MKPLYIFRHIACDMQGFLCDYLYRREIPFELICIDPQERLSCDLDSTSGLIFLGAPTSVNNPEHWISDEISLIQDAAAIRLPVMGICFGGQLITRALGGHVRKSEQVQIGWHPVVTLPQASSALSGADLPANFHVFEWHEESFSLPQGATPLFCDSNNNYQGFLHGNCLAMQFHMEMTEELIEASLNHFQDCLPPASSGIQSSEQIRLDNPRYLAEMHKVAESIYGWWLDQLVI